jgi:hypothetical protein
MRRREGVAAVEKVETEERLDKQEVWNLVVVGRTRSRFTQSCLVDPSTALTRGRTQNKNKTKRNETVRLHTLKFYMYFYYYY